jgi:hypothetical protein
LITIGILGVIVASGIPNWDPRRQDVNTAMAMVLGEFRYTRARAITSGTHFSIKMNSANQYQVQRHVQDPNDGTWPVDSVTRTVDLPSNLVFWMFPDTIEFNTRGLMVTELTPGNPTELFVNIYDQVGGHAHQFSVWPSGQVNEEF